MVYQPGLFFPNRAYEATGYTGGSWRAGFAAANMGVRGFADVSRSTTAASADSQFIMDMGATRALRAVGLFGHNLTTSATLEVNVGTTSGGAEAYDGVAATCWPMATLQSSLTAYGIEEDLWYKDGWPIIVVLPAFASGRYVQFKISDTGNPAGYIEVATAFAGGGLLPGHGVDYQGFGDGFEDLSGVDYSPSGALWAYARSRMRLQSFVLSWVSHTELAIVRELERQCGRTDDVLYVPDCNDMAYSQRYGFLATLKELSQAEYPSFDIRKKAFSLKERR
jgi:hypothetical protein